MDLSISGKRRIDRPKRVEKDIWQGATSCYALIRDGIEKGALFQMNDAPLYFLRNHYMLCLPNFVHGCFI
jgi:hypothetical protein